MKVKKIGLRGEGASLGPHSPNPPFRDKLIPTCSVCFYHPQTKFWSKVIFSEPCVKNSVHREGMHARGACVPGGHA